MPIESKDFALVVGINHYPNYGSKGLNLKGAIPDAQAVHDWLIDDVRGGGLPPSQCHLMLSSVDAGGATSPGQDQIDSKLEEIDAQVVATGGGRRFYFYFSGHGQCQTSQDIALCLPHWSRRRMAALSQSAYRKYLVECLPFKEVVFLLDCCQSFSLGAKGQETELGCALPQAGAGQTLTFVGRATEFQKAAYEGPVAPGVPGAVDDGEPIVRGFFTEALLAAWKGAAARPAGGVSASALHSFLFKVVPRLARRQGFDQKPRIEPFSVPAGDSSEPIFGAALPTTTVDVEIRFKAGRAGSARLEGPSLEPIREADVATAPWQETLPAAKYWLTHLASGDNKMLDLTSSSGGVVDVEL